MYNGGLVRRASPLLSLRKNGLLWSIWFALCSEKEINVEPLPFDVCEQLLLSDCKMHLIIVYSDTKKTLLCSSIFEHETAASMTTILKHYVVPVMSHTYTPTNTLQGCLLKKTQESILHKLYRKVRFFPAKPMQDSPKTICIRMIFSCALKTALMWDHSSSGGTADLFAFD